LYSLLREGTITSGFSRNEVIFLPKTIVRDGETLDDAMKRFKRQVNKAGTIADYRKHDFFLKKGLRRKLKSENAKRKH
jgi:small subunit ribosomal protein S21